MVCPVCELRVEEFDSNDDRTRYVCCHCNALITIERLTDDEVCHDSQN